MARREEITWEMVDAAVEIYLRHAYGDSGAPRAPAVVDREHQDPFEAFVDETPESDEDEDPPLRRYTMRLGNRSYPFMKLVLEEHIVRGEFFFSVDTHDHIDVRPDFPDYEDWMRLKRFNLKLKREIEAEFQRAGLPTLAEIRRKVEKRLPQRLPGRRGTRILVVDDEDDEAETLVRLLGARGYKVRRAADGLEAIDEIRRHPPDLIVLDYEMPEMDGLSLIAELKKDPATRTIPILLTTASRVLAEERDKADEFLPKPFDSAKLLGMVEKLLVAGRGA